MTRKFRRSTFERSIIFKFEISAILKFCRLKFEPPSISFIIYNFLFRTLRGQQLILESLENRDSSLFTQEATARGILHGAHTFIHTPYIKFESSVLSIQSNYLKILQILIVQYFECRLYSYSDHSCL